MDLQQSGSRSATIFVHVGNAWAPYLRSDLLVPHLFIPKLLRTELTATLAKRFTLRRRALWSFSGVFARGSGGFRRFRAGNVCGKLCRGVFRLDFPAARRVSGRFRPENRAARLVLGDAGWKKSEVDLCRRRI